MALDSYTALQASVANWLDRSDLTSVVPDLILLAEKSLNRTLRTRRMIQRSNATVDSEYSTLPSTFLEMKAISVQGTYTTPLVYKTAQQIDSQAEQYQSAAKPQFYTIIEDYFQVQPVPDQAYTLEMIWYQEIPSLASNSTNHVLANSPDLYLYGSLVAAQPFLREDERLPTWQGLYNKALAEVMAEDTRAVSSGSNLTINYSPIG